MKACLIIYVPFRGNSMLHRMTLWACVPRNLVSEARVKLSYWPTQCDDVTRGTHTYKEGARLSLNWSGTKLKIAGGCMDEQYLQGHKCPAVVSLPFLPDLHTEGAVSWRHLNSVWVANTALSYLNVEGLYEHGYGTMPQTKGNLVSYLSPGTSSSLKAPVLPSKPKDIKSSWQIICSSRSSQWYFTYDGCIASLPNRPIERPGSGRAIIPKSGGRAAYGHRSSPPCHQGQAYQYKVLPFWLSLSLLGMVTETRYIKRAPG